LQQVSINSYQITTTIQMYSLQATIAVICTIYPFKAPQRKINYQLTLQD